MANFNRFGRHRQSQRRGGSLGRRHVAAYNYSSWQCSTAEIMIIHCTTALDTQRRDNEATSHLPFNTNDLGCQTGNISCQLQPTTFNRLTMFSPYHCDMRRSVLLAPHPHRWFPVFPDFDPLPENNHILRDHGTRRCHRSITQRFLR